MSLIVVPTDFSPTSAAALTYASFLADRTGYDLEVLHVHDGYGEVDRLISVRGNPRACMAVQRRLDEFARFSIPPQHFTGTRHEDTLPLVATRHVIGTPGPEVIRRSQSPEVALMVMGGVGSGAGSRRPQLFGGVARAVALQAGCPVLLVPAGDGVPSISRAAIAFDEVTPLRAVSAAFAPWRQQLELDTRLVHVMDKDRGREEEKELELLEENLRTGFPDYPTQLDLLPPGPLADRLPDYLLEEEIDLLVLGRRRRSRLASLFIGSEVGPLLTACGVPLLIFPIENYA